MFSSSHVMIYDEDVFMGKLLENVLESFGVMRITMVHDMEEAKALITKMEFSAVFMDWHGHDKPSLEFLSYVRLHGDISNPRIPVIIVTAHTAMQRVLFARDKGASEVLAKPIAPSHVFDKLYSAIYSERAFIDLDEYVGPDRRRNKEENYHGYDRRKDVSLGQSEIDRVMSDGNT